jgi:hypothetical protein
MVDDAATVLQPFQIVPAPASGQPWVDYARGRCETIHPTVRQPITSSAGWPIPYCLNPGHRRIKRKGAHLTMRAFEAICKVRSRWTTDRLSANDETATLL